MDEHTLISISTLNDFIFCPYSIYLHNVYMEADEGLYHATPQYKGRYAHRTVDEKNYSTRTNELTSLSVCSDKLGLIGKIDLYKVDKQCLVERKYRLPSIFKGQIYQLWAQYYCMIEMGYEVTSLAFYETSTNKTHPVKMPTEVDYEELKRFVATFRDYNPNQPIHVNPNKCAHCIYCSLCDKTMSDNVYT